MKVAYVAQGNLDEALRIVKSEETVDYYNLNAIVQGYAKRGKVQKALESFKFLRESVANEEWLNRHKANYETTDQPPDYLRVLSAVAVANGAAGDLNESVKWARSQDTFQEKAYALVGVAEGLLKK